MTFRTTSHLVGVVGTDPLKGAKLQEGREGRGGGTRVLGEPLDLLRVERGVCKPTAVRSAGAVDGVLRGWRVGAGPGPPEEYNRWDRAAREGSSLGWG